MKIRRKRKCKMQKKMQIGKSKCKLVVNQKRALARLSEAFRNLMVSLMISLLLFEKKIENQTKELLIAGFLNSSEEQKPIQFFFVGLFFVVSCN